LGALGLSFKPGTDDLRESPMVALIEMLLGKGYEVRIYDREVSEARVLGANRAYVEREIPHVWSLMTQTPGDVLEWCDTVVVGNGTGEYRTALRDLQRDVDVIDLVRVMPDSLPSFGRYHGLCWG
jgi:GDP-mannose 6-dehydrogenase